MTRDFDLHNVPGIQFNEPPAYRIGAITEAINRATSVLADDESMALVSVFNETGANAVWIARIYEKNNWDVQAVAWIGKEWKGSLDYGAAVRVARKIGPG